MNSGQRAAGSGATNFGLKPLMVPPPRPQADSKKTDRFEIGSLSEHQNYNLENVRITTATLIKFARKIYTN
jgi:hypothetical protein